MDILRSWICDNKACGHWFDSDQSYPHCPTCGCIRTSWRPNGGHIVGKNRGAEKELRELADIFKMGDMNSAQEGQPAKKVATPSAPSQGKLMRNFSGFAAEIQLSDVAQCLPAANKVDFKVKATPGRALPPNPTYDAPTPMVVSRHKDEG